MNVTDSKNSGHAWALIPFFVFLVFYFGLSLFAKDFNAIPMPVAFLVASAVAIVQNRTKRLHEKIDLFTHGMGESNIMLMCLVFILAGIFSAVAKEMNAIESAVVLTRTLIPGHLLLVGMFSIACLVSLAIGTSCGTIATLVPLALELAAAVELSPEWMLSAVIGGSMFGDNMSIISDTTIAATRTQGIPMHEKFITNLRFALPTVVVTILIYIFSAPTVEGDLPLRAVTATDLILVLPYLLILILSFCRFNVMALLFFGILLASGIGIAFNQFDSITTTFKAMQSGALGMAETLMIALLSGGMMHIVRINGGIDYVLHVMCRRIKSTRACEFCVAGLVSLVNVFTANNTVAIVIAGPVAKELSDKHACAPNRIASILDAASCIVQGILPYGAQMLIAIGLAQGELSIFRIISHLYYQHLLVIALILFICIRPRKQRA